jgi:hypothetical protein
MKLQGVRQIASPRFLFTADGFFYKPCRFIEISGGLFEAVVVCNQGAFQRRGVGIGEYVLVYP